MAKSKKLLLAAAAFGFLLGLSVLLYPFIHGYAADRQMADVAGSFVKRREIREQEDRQEEGFLPAPDKPLPEPYGALRNAMREYNGRILREHQEGLKGSGSYEEPSFRLEEFGLSDEVFGILRVEKLGLEMPIYLGATYDHMARGVAHLSQTSIPVGGDSTNCVLAGHRGWHGATYFRNITDLVPGDTVEITNLWETLTYRVSGTQIIEPDDVEAIHIRPGRELITLLTCHPYASGGRQRYLVICERV